MCLFVVHLLHSFLSFWFLINLVFFFLLFSLSAHAGGAHVDAGGAYSFH